MNYVTKRSTQEEDCGNTDLCIPGNLPTRVNIVVKASTKNSRTTVHVNEHEGVRFLCMRCKKAFPAHSMLKDHQKKCFI